MQDIDNPSTEFPTPKIWKEIQQYFGGIPLVKGKLTNWRTRAKLAVRGQLGSPKIGLFKPGTHEVEDLIDCIDHHPSINEALDALRKSQFHPYDEISLSGDLRYVQLTVHRPTKKIQLVLVSNGEGKCDNLAKHLEKSHDWHSIWINTQEGSTNTIFGPKWTHHSGPRFLEENLLGRRVCFHPACFMQAHMDLFEVILADIRAQLLSNKKVTEFYSGVGAIGLPLADNCSAITLIEINSYAEESFYKSSPPPNATFVTSPAKESAHLLEEVLIVDPPRKGLDKELLNMIRESSLEQILYLSCNFESLKRDLELLKEMGWVVSKATGYLLFPNTNHVELLVSLGKAEG